MPFVRFWLLAGAVLLSACSPTFNWRNAPLEGSPLQAQMPCKPERAERQVPLTPAGATLHLISCEAGGLNFVLAWANVGAADGQATALDAWQTAGWASLRQQPVAPAEPPAGWRAWAPALTRAQHLRGWQGPGLDHQGRALQAHQLYFAHGSVVYQAAVYGSNLPEAAVAPFFEALRLPAAP